MNSYVIELENVHKAFAKRAVLKGVELSVPTESVFAFLGNNGQGKSTTIRLIVGLLQPDEGSVRVLGQDIRQSRKAVLARLGCLVDAPSAYPNLRASEFLDIGRRLKALPFAEVDRVLAIVGLSAERKVRIAHFSLGMKQRLALAHALLGQPPLLILDEPTNGLDPEGIREIRELLVGLPAAAACTVFFSSHQLDEVEKTATHLAVLQGGSIRLQVPMAKLARDKPVHLLLTVNDAYAAAPLLAELGYAAVSESPHQLRVEAVAREDAHRVNARLVQAGFDLHEATFRCPSLEQWFLQDVLAEEGA